MAFTDLPVLGKNLICQISFFFQYVISSSGQSPGRAIVLPSASALASASMAASALANSLTFKFLCEGQCAVRRAIVSL